MNKTININLAGLFFHIDEDAFAKLQHYLDAVKRSLAGTEGRDEIIQDIEARIAELFTERIKHERQVISTIEVDQVIEIMGQPEDYKLDDTIFEDEQPKASTYTSNSSTTHSKKLYRDTDNSYLGGVSSGLGHYLGIAPLWIRILFVLLAFLSSGGFALLYIGFWIFVPSAKTTAQKLEMRGEPVNIDNIQRKVKEGFDSVADSVKRVDYEKYGNKAREGAGSVADGVRKFVVLLLTVLAKFIGILLILVGGITIVGLFIGLFTAGTLGFIDGGLGDYFGLFNASTVPLWVLSLLLFLALAIPFFAIFYLGLKILVTNLKRMSWAMKISLIVVWLASIVILSAVGIKQAMDFSQRSSTTQTELLTVNPLDTLRVNMIVSDNENPLEKGLFLDMDTNGKPFASMGNIDLTIKKSDDSGYKLELIKKARGYNNTAARAHAEDIVYPFEVEDNVLKLPKRFKIAEGASFRAQELELILYVPENGHISIDNSIKYLLNYRNGIMQRNFTDHLLSLKNGRLICEDCPEESSTDTSSEWQYKDASPDNRNVNGVYTYDQARQKANKQILDSTSITSDSTTVILDSIQK